MEFPNLEFVYDGALLSFRGPVQPQQWELIDDFETALRCHCDDMREPHWGNLRDNLAEECGISMLTAPEGFLDGIQTLVFAFTPWWETAFNEEIERDLATCAAYEVSRLKDIRLFPMLLEAYAAGGMPCGWSGAYPNGKLCVYWQADADLSRKPVTAEERRIEYQKRQCREKILAGKANVQGTEGAT